MSGNAYDNMAADPARTDELVLVDGLDRQVGAATKERAHREGLLHRAFSVVLVRNGAAGPELLLAQRAEGKAAIEELIKYEEAMVSEEYANDGKVKSALAESGIVSELWRYEILDFADRFADAGGDTHVYLWKVPSTNGKHVQERCSGRGAGLRVQQPGRRDVRGRS